MMNNTTTSSSLLRRRLPGGTILTTTLILTTTTNYFILLVNAACQDGNKPFQNRRELKIAIDTCFFGDDAATAATIAEYNEEKCNNEVKSTYGWPMNTWCTGEVDDMQLLFVGKRDFNEDISGELDVIM